MEFLNEAELTSAIANELIEVVGFVMGEIEDNGEKEIESIVYNSYLNGMYERTYEFKQGWDIDVGASGNSVEGSYFYNPDNLSVGDQYNGQHASVVDGSSQVDNMPYYIYQSGKTGCIPRPLKRNAWQALDRFLSNSMIRSFMETGLNRTDLPWQRGTGAITKTTWT